MPPTRTLPLLLGSKGCGGAIIEFADRAAGLAPLLPVLERHFG